MGALSIPIHSISRPQRSIFFTTREYSMCAYMHSIEARRTSELEITDENRRRRVGGMLDAWQPNLCLALLFPEFCFSLGARPIYFLLDRPVIGRGKRSARKDSGFGWMVG